MDGVPVRGAAILRRILAHRRDDDAVGEREAAKLIGAEELTHVGRTSRRGRVFGRSLEALVRAKPEARAQKRCALRAALLTIPRFLLCNREIAVI